MRPEDFRIVRFRQRRGATTIFVVDASGSLAMHRLAEVKGAIELLLADCYVRRDHVALIAFRGPSRRDRAAADALDRARASGADGNARRRRHADRRRLGRSRLASRILSRRKGQTPLIVLMTDGRANIGRDGAPGRPQATRDALDAARRIRADAIAALTIDTAPPSPATRRRRARSPRR